VVRAAALRKFRSTKIAHRYQPQPPAGDMPPAPGKGRSSTAAGGWRRPCGGRTWDSAAWTAHEDQPVPPSATSPQSAPLDHADVVNVVDDASNDAADPGHAAPGLAGAGPASRGAGAGPGHAGATAIGGHSRPVPPPPFDELLTSFCRAFDELHGHLSTSVDG
jgi:hypothetical protein